MVARVLQRKISQGLNLSGKKVLLGHFLGFPISSWLIAQQATVIYAVDNYYEGMEETSGVLKDDLHSLWSLARKFQLPAVLFVTVLLGWRHPFVLFINVALLLFCTRPSPLSIYVFIEQLRQSDMRRDPSLRKTKFLYVKNVEIEDYRMFCLAKVELRDVKINVIGILGGWWIIHTTPSRRP
ncbi:hypothetical protein HPP92_002679 [Vanilla planifolia]|uniref:Uncharacterized protein n=1 Tax=Vanilla planifolia TaxID=51239 RepID=A0A835S7L2_VANPL|nr:hypothetical protein HPP92_003083 [Vanilla planifolia]KAG0502607.1 hypothetical protein HPP92_002679 [Vanilla planifolia]